jgi:hypothetical protein
MKCLAKSKNSTAAAAPVAQLQTTFASALSTVVRGVKEFDVI